MDKIPISQKEFYEQQYCGSNYASGISDRAEVIELEKFIESYSLKDKKILEIGCGRGAFQNLVENWTGVDIAESVRSFIKKPFHVAPCETLPFEDETFDAIWSITTLEHVENPEAALKEVIRVLKPGGVVYLAPAWHCRSWASEGYEVRPWSDFDLKGKLVKVSIPIRNNIFIRAVPTLIFRLARETQYFLIKKPLHFFYIKLNPNYEKYWCADSDATCSMDPHEMLLWFKSRSWEILSHPSFLKRFFVRHGAIIVQKPNRQKFKLALLASHPIQYQAPFFLMLANQSQIDLTVLYYSDFGVKNYKDTGFGKELKWDRPLLDGYKYEFLKNTSPCPNLSNFFGLINPSLIKRLDKKDFDAVWIHGWARFSDWISILTCISKEIPILLRGESNLLSRIPVWKRIIKRIILGWLFKNVSVFLAIGKYNAEFYEYYGVPKEKIFLVPYTIDNDFFISKAEELLLKKNELRKKYNLPIDLPLVMFSGKLIDVKRPMDLLNAYEQVLKETKAGLIFVGDGILRDGLEKYCSKNNLEHVYFMGFRNQTELPEFYAMSDIFVLPSEHEPWGLVVNEAMCFGLPVIVSDLVGASGDLVKEGENGFIYPGRNITELKEKLMIILSDNELIKRMRKTSKENIVKWSYKEDIKGILSYINLRKY